MIRFPDAVLNQMKASVRLNEDARIFQIMNQAVGAGEMNAVFARRVACAARKKGSDFAVAEFARAPGVREIAEEKMLDRKSVV